MGRDISGQQVEEVLGTCVMKGIVGEQESFESNPELYKVASAVMGSRFLHLVRILAVAF